MLLFRRNGKVELIENTQIPQIFLITKALFQTDALMQTRSTWKRWINANLPRFDPSCFFLAFPFC